MGKALGMLPTAPSPSPWHYTELYAAVLAAGISCYFLWVRTVTKLHEQTKGNISPGPGNAGEASNHSMQLKASFLLKVVGKCAQWQQYWPVPAGRGAEAGSREALLLHSTQLTKLG